MSPHVFVILVIYQFWFFAVTNHQMGVHIGGHYKNKIKLLQCIMSTGCSGVYIVGGINLPGTHWGTLLLERRIWSWFSKFIGSIRFSSGSELQHQKLQYARSNSNKLCIHGFGCINSWKSTTILRLIPNCALTTNHCDFHSLEQIKLNE